MYIADQGGIWKIMGTAIFGLFDAQRDHIQKAFNNYQISIPNTKYCLTHIGYHVLLKGTFVTGDELYLLYPLNMWYIPFKRVILCFSGWSLDEKRVFTGYDVVLYCYSCQKGEEPHIWLEEHHIWSESSYTVPLVFYIPQTFHNSLSPN